jgi:hypothetical protein
MKKKSMALDAKAMSWPAWYSRWSHLFEDLCDAWEGYMVLRSWSSVTA